MMEKNPTILALDFDGVICNGLVEYFQTTWRTYGQIWHPETKTPPAELAPHFYKLRPVIETGWEMPILLRALILGKSEEGILQDWASIRQHIVESEHINSKEVAKKVDAVRDDWIKTDLEGWLALHQFYSGVVQRVQEILDSPTQLFIVTTKEGRFVKQLLQQQGVNLPESNIFGKEVKCPKYETLRKLIQTAETENVNLWFVEDRMETLKLVEKQTDLQAVQLFLADWGYNTAESQQLAQENPNIHLLSLDQFSQDFPAWLE